MELCNFFNKVFHRFCGKLDTFPLLPCGKLCGNCVKLLDLQAFAAFWLLFFACVKLVFSRGDRAFLKRIGLAVFPKCEKPFFGACGKRSLLFAVLFCRRNIISFVNVLKMWQKSAIALDTYARKVYNYIVKYNCSRGERGGGKNG